FFPHPLVMFVVILLVFLRQAKAYPTSPSTSITTVDGSGTIVPPKPVTKPLVLVRPVKSLTSPAKATDTLSPSVTSASLKARGFPPSTGEGPGWKFLTSISKLPVVGSNRNGVCRGII